MHRIITRRKFFRKSGQAMMASGAAMCGGSIPEVHASSRASVKGVDYYRKLGVTPFINAAGTYTVLSASTMPGRSKQQSRWPLSNRSILMNCWWRRESTSLSASVARLPWSLRVLHRRSRWEQPPALLWAIGLPL